MSDAYDRQSDTEGEKQREAADIWSKSGWYRDEAIQRATVLAGNSGGQAVPSFWEAQRGKFAGAGSQQAIPTISGWTPPVMTSDYGSAARLVTQADVDRFMVMESHLRSVSRCAAELQQAADAMREAMSKHPLIP